MREPRAYELGQWGTEFHPDLLVNDNDPVLTKHRISPFYATELEAILRAQCINRLLITGVSTDYVIQSCAREAHDRDYDTVVVEDLCAASTDEIHQQAIASLKRLVSVVHSSELLQE
ncbi:cysteine hydrolase family protein [Endozoicomonas arenosclerae]|uniref:cysteine hydrolase family protein n=1 Tax=Endozoicomonas arenosclerae TaxID=1633495 RepID=UPI000A92A518|nr:cysteine hydrolase [Endozoicomonas arenosclerae]